MSFVIICLRKTPNTYFLVFTTVKYFHHVVRMTPSGCGWFAVTDMRDSCPRASFILWTPFRNNVRVKYFLITNHSCVCRASPAGSSESDQLHGQQQCLRSASPTVQQWWLRSIIIVTRVQCPVPWSPPQHQWGPTWSHQQCATTIAKQQQQCGRRTWGL